ncbi:hypothetical protein QBC37DRAFT_484030 [Rhypophila decipiens]|uniref:2EXR domain-containing protein n=1 Tax=Rhypophila decipiens TaxID=261697 RepID=A0AAN6Y9W6_9PEZI|nr:hypothetical protein QBC37DRAFT_484030 [Rhypophila decipiens]
MAQTFTLFSYLPWEVRNKIWHLAANARGSTPGAHFFHVYSYNHELSVPESDDAVVVSSRTHDIVQRSEQEKEIMGIPRRVPLYHTVEKSDLFGKLYEHTSSASNADNCRNEALQNLHRATEAAGGIPNPSMFLVDGGLWTACKESRQFVKDRVCPSWFQWTDTLTHYQYPRNPTKSLRYEYNSGFRNIAFAWEPAFDYEVLYDSGARVVYRPTPRSDWVFDIFSRSLNSLESEYSQPPYKIWIIDYRIRPKQLAPEDMELYRATMAKTGRDKQIGLEFHATDRKYTSVVFDDNEDLAIPWDTGMMPSDKSDTRKSTPLGYCRLWGSISFARMMRQYMQWLDGVDGLDVDYDDHGVPIPPDHRNGEIGVLACEFFDDLG